MSNEQQPLHPSLFATNHGTVTQQVALNASAPQIGGTVAGSGYAGGQAMTFTGVTSTREGAATAALVAKAKAEIESRYLMALHRPRNLAQVRQVLLAECRRPGFADAAIFAKPIGGDKTIEGLSIRFAEAAARAYGNLSSESTIIYDDAHTRTVRVTVVDLESNNPWSTDIAMEKVVERKFLKRGQVPIAQRTNSYGDQVFLVEATEDDLLNKQGALVSKALRTCILRVIPGDLQDEALELCRATLADKDAKDPAAARNTLLDGFARLGVTPVQIGIWLGRPVETMTAAEFNMLRGVGVAMRDGEATWAQVMDVRNGERGVLPADAKPAKGTAAVKDKLKKQPAAAPGPVTVESAVETPAAAAAHEAREP
jgi:hypothetical protein